MSANHGGVPPILAQKFYNTRSVFAPESRLLREARRQIIAIAADRLRSQLEP